MTIHYSCDNDLARNVFNENILNIFNTFFHTFYPFQFLKKVYFKNFGLDK